MKNQGARLGKKKRRDRSWREERVKIKARNQECEMISSLPHPRSQYGRSTISSVGRIMKVARSPEPKSKW